MVIYSGISHWKWWFSIAMLNYQRVSDSDGYCNGKHSNQVHHFFRQTIPRGGKLMEIESGEFNDFLNSGDRANHVFCHVFAVFFRGDVGQLQGVLKFYVRITVPRILNKMHPEKWLFSRALVTRNLDCFFLGCKSNRTYSSVAWRMCAAANDVISPPHPPQGKPHKTHKAIQTHVGFSTRRLNHPLKWTIFIHFP